jgi:tetratricopeptide (TPR) repeat protein
MKPQNKVAAKKAERLFIQGRELHKAGDYANAEAAYKQVLKLIPTQPDALHLLGVAAFQQNRFEESERLLAAAIRYAPNAALPYYNYGNALRSLARFDEAIAAFTKAFELDPSNIVALEHLGNIHKELNQFDKAHHYYDRLLEIDPKNAIGRCNKAIALLTEGHLSEGWQLYESRVDCKFEDHELMTSKVPLLAPEWDGKRPSKPLLVLPEQGLGDQIFYGGMLGDLETAGIEALVCVDDRILELFRRSFPKLMFASNITLTPEFARDHIGAQVTMASMGQWLRRSANDFKKIRSPFLQCDKERRDQLRRKLKNPKRLLVGLSWQSLRAKHGASKTCSLANLVPLLSTENIDFVDLQYSDTSAERAEIQAQHGIQIQRVDEIDNKTDIEGLSALIDACDVVVTVSNTTAHLAAALGKPTLVLLPWHTPLWYWHLGSIDSMWYPSAVLLRQEKAFDWKIPVQQAAKIINGLAG